MRKLLLLAACLLAAAPAQAAWREASTDHFVIYSEQSPTALRAFATRLERFDKAMRLLRKVPDEPVGAANRVTVYVVRDLAAVRKLHGAGAGNSTFGVAGFYIPRASGSIAITPRSGSGDTKFDLDAEAVLLHEYSHHFMMRNFPRAYPAWFIEGFAEFSSTALFRNDGSVGIGAPALHRAYGLLSGNPLPLEKMLAASTSKLSSAQMDALYGRGWLLTHYLYFEPSRQGQLTDYVLRLNNGEPPLDAARAAFGDLKALDRELNAYLKRPKMKYIQLPADRVQIGPIKLRELSAAEDAVMDVKIRSRRGVTREEAIALLPAVQRAAAPFPNDPAAQATLAEAEFDAGNLDAGEAAADRALAADPKHIGALIHKAKIRMARAVAAESDDPAIWKDVRKWIMMANRLDPDHPEPLILFHASFQSQGLEPTANAKLGLATALALAPQDRDLRATVAYQHLADGKAAEARATLAPIAFDPHGGTASERAAEAIAKLDAGKVEEALAIWSRSAEDGEEESAG